MGVKTMDPVNEMGKKVLVSLLKCPLLLLCGKRKKYYMGLPYTDLVCCTGMECRINFDLTLVL